jgi:hypothetical protein
MALIKLSICSYILMLDFSKGYRIVIWLSVIIHLGINFVFPSVILLGECQPISKHWDVAGTQPGSCWAAKPRVISGKSCSIHILLLSIANQGLRLFRRSNKYPDRPNLHRRATGIHLPRSTTKAHTLGCPRRLPPRPHVKPLRPLLAPYLPQSYQTNNPRTTSISALKLYEMKSLNDSPDPTYTSLNLSIFAVAEVFVGAFTASLPPLRKTFETVLHRFLPESIMTASRSRKSQGKGTGNSYAMKEVGNSYVLNGKGMSSQQVRPKHDLDNDSEHSILQEQQSLEGKDTIGTITCTTEISMSGDDRGSVRSRAHDWV